MKCPTCKGEKFISISVVGQELKKAIKIPCFDCFGTGIVTEVQRDGIERRNDLWCKCGAKSGSTFHPDAFSIKHHYTCNDCGKVVQIG
jgi:hypothetical protein